MKRPVLLILLSIAATVSGCGGKSGPKPMLSIFGVVKPYRQVRFRLTLRDKPIYAAHLRAVAIDTGSMALPVSGEVVEQAMYAWGDTASTDEEGFATLKLFDATPHLIEVAPPPFGELAERGPWSWTIEQDGASLTTTLASDSAEGRPRLELIPK